jgi:hypothetical protein
MEAEVAECVQKGEESMCTWDTYMNVCTFAHACQDVTQSTLNISD